MGPLEEQQLLTTELSPENTYMKIWPIVLVFWEVQVIKKKNTIHLLPCPKSKTPTPNAGEDVERKN